MTTSPSDISAATIRRLKIDRFRGIESLTWWPEPGVNIILGGGDVGKTTILEAIGLLLSPTNTTVLSDADYFRRKVELEFTIEAVMSVPAKAGVNQQNKMSWPWEWNGKDLQQPSFEEGASGAAGVHEPVYCFRVRGTNESDLAYEIVNPDGSTNSFHVGLRRAIGMVRLGGDDRNDRDLRLVQGSALDRLLDDKGLRARLGTELAEEDVKEQLKADAKRTLATLDETFKGKALPSELGLGLTGGPGLSLGALVGLTAKKDQVALPLASWGAGTRRLSALTIAASLQGERPITVVDELERGFEPYRQRSLVAGLESSKSQVFVTTHSAAAINASSAAALWYVDVKGRIGRLQGKEIARHQKRDPEMFVARFTVVAEGATESGFASRLLEKAIGGSLLTRGVWVTIGGGNESTLSLLQALILGGLSFGGIADDEGHSPTLWTGVKSQLGELLFRWKKGCLEENVVPLFKANLEELIKDPQGEKTGDRLRSLAIRLGIEEATFAAISARAGDNLVTLIVEAATGTIPVAMQNADDGIKKALKRHGKLWFKTEEGGRELADKVLQLGVWSKLEPQLLPFLNAIRHAVDLTTITALPL